MTNTTPEAIEAALERNAARRQRRKHPAMAVSGRRVKELQRLIIRRKRSLDR